MNEEVLTWVLWVGGALLFFGLVGGITARFERWPVWKATWKRRWSRRIYDIRKKYWMDESMLSIPVTYDENGEVVSNPESMSLRRQYYAQIEWRARMKRRLIFGAIAIPTALGAAFWYAPEETEKVLTLWAKPVVTFSIAVWMFARYIDDELFPGANLFWQLVMMGSIFGAGIMSIVWGVQAYLAW